MIKELPNDTELEQSILGCFLIDNEIVEKFFSNGELEYFYGINEKIIAKAIYQLALDGVAIDLLSLKSTLEDNKKLEKVGGVTYLAELIDIVPTSSNRELYTNKLRELYKQREIIKEARRLESIGFGGTDLDINVEKSFDNINKALSEGISRATNIEDNIGLLEEYINENKTKDLIGYSWGIDWLDKYTGGIRKSKTYRIGAPSGLGKTNLIYQLIANLIKQNAKVLFISLENTIESTYIKFLSTIQEVNPNEIEKGNIKPDIEFLRKYKDNFILTDQLFELGEIKREILKVKPDVVILDYIGLVDIKGNDEKTKYNTYADEVKKFVQKHKWLSWVDLSNLNKDDDEEKIRIHKGFNGAGKLKNNIDFGLHLFYYKPFYEYKKLVKETGTEESYKKFEATQVLTFLISKNRLGPSDVENEFGINFNQGISYKEIPIEKKELWKI